MKPFHDITDPKVAKALAHPLRARLLGALEDRTASPSELAAELDVPLGVLSYHIRRLTALGFLTLVRRVPRRGAVEHYYTATVRPPVTDEAWGATPDIVKQASITGALGRLGAQVSAAAAAGGFNSDEARISQASVCLDDQGWHELASELAALAVRVEAIESQSRARLGESPEPTEVTGPMELAGPTEVTGPTEVAAPTELAAPARMAATEGATGSEATRTATAPAPAGAPARGTAAELKHDATLVLILYEDPPAPPAHG